MQTRRQVLASLPSVAMPAMVEKPQDPDPAHLVQKLVEELAKQRGGRWTSHVDSDFVLISRKL